MPGQDAGQLRFDFEAFEVDLDRGEICRAGRVVKLRPKSLRVLEYFMAHPGRLVTRDEIMAVVWDRAVVTEDSLTQCVTEIRRAIGDGDRRAVRTVARRGYIFDARPSPDCGVSPSTAENAAVTVTPELQRGPSLGRRHREASGRSRLATVALTPLLLGMTAFFGLLSPLPAYGPGTSSHMLEVAPAAGASTDAQRAAGDLYRLGRYLFLRRGPGDLATAERYLERAVAVDPDRGEAWTALAGVYAARASHDMNDPLYRAQERHRALERALSLDPQSAEAHVRMGRLHVAFGRPDAARASFETAYEYGPDDPTVLATLSVRAMIGGRADEAVQLARRCVEAEPLSAVHRANYARLLLAMGAAEPAREQLVLAMQLSPRLVELHGEVARALMLQDRLAEARTSVLSMPAGLLRDQLQVLLESGPEAAMSEARLQDDESWISLFLRAEIEAHRGAIDSAFALLDQAREGWLRTQVGAGGSPAFFAMELAVSPLLRSLHGDDRWHALMLDVATHLA